MRTPWIRALILLGAPIALRVVLAGVVDDFEDDAYTRDLIAQRMADELRSGRFGLRSLLHVSIWLPAWQTLCAVVESLVRQPYWAPKIISAVFGGATPALVFVLALRMRASDRVAWTAWALAMLAPWHALYSAVGMTEAFYGFWLTLATYAFVRAERDNRWLIVCALALFPATWTRFEGWFLVGALPGLAWIQRRATSATWLAATVLFVAPTALWVALNAYVTGDPLAFARSSHDNVSHFIAFRGGSWSSRGPWEIGRHLFAALAVNGVVVSAVGLRTLVSRRTRDTDVLATVLGCTFGLLFGLWLARRHVGWRRYYTPFAMPLSLLAAIGLDAIRWRRLAWTLVALETLLTVALQVRFLTGWGRPWLGLRRDAAAFVRTHDGTVYCDEPTIRVIAGVSAARFVNRWSLPASGAGAIDAMRRAGVRWVVYAHIDYSMLPTAFPWMARGDSRVPFTRVTPFVMDRGRVGAFPVHVYSLDPP